MVQTRWGKALVGSRWSRGLYAAMKCVCFCYLGVELALKRGSLALLGVPVPDLQAAIQTGALVLTWATGAFCLVRGLPVLIGGWKYFAASGVQVKADKAASQGAA